MIIPGLMNPNSAKRIVRTSSSQRLASNVMTMKMGVMTLSRNEPPSPMATKSSRREVSPGCLASRLVPDVEEQDAGSGTLPLIKLSTSWHCATEESMGWCWN